MERNRLEQLIRQYKAGTLDAAGLRDLYDSLRDEGSQEAWDEAMRVDWDKLAMACPTDDDRGEQMLQRAMHVIDASAPSNRRHHWSSYRRWAVAAAATGIIVFGWAIWRASTSSVDAVTMPSTTMVQHVPLTEAVEQVTLTRSDGSKITLDALGDGPLDADLSTGAVKAGDGLRYSAAGPLSGPPSYHTIATPRGGRFRITLSDGSRVWLNAASSLRFPVTFPSGPREVEVTGQAYFEVARQPGRPFRVRIRDAEVEVLGTHFDVMAYPEESELRTTLVEGSVRFRNPAGEAMLSPGQQSYARGAGRPHVRQGVDLEHATGWKEGMLEFKGDDIATVCRTLSRAYDVTLSYDVAIQELFYARFPLETPLGTLLQALEMTGKVRFERKGNTIRARS